MLRQLVVAIKLASLPFFVPIPYVSITHKRCVFFSLLPAPSFALESSSALPAADRVSLRAAWLALLSHAPLSFANLVAASLVPHFELAFSLPSMRLQLSIPHSGS